MTVTNTTTSFDAMINEYLPNDLLTEELIKRNWLLNSMERDDSWLGGDLIVPFKGSRASSVAFGALTGSTDISEGNFQRGSVTDYQELWGSMIFNEADLMKHGKVSEQNFLKLLPDEVDDFIDYMKEVSSMAMLNAGAFAKAEANPAGGTGFDSGDGQSDGTIRVDHPERFVIGQKVILDDDDSSQSTYYVTAVDLNIKSVTLATARGGATHTNVTDYTVAQNAKFYHDGVLVAGVVTNKFGSLRDALLSSTNGGSSTLYGKTKTAYPYLQAINVDGSTINASNLLEKIFLGWSTVRQRGRGKATKVAMSLKHFGTAMIQIEVQKGGFKVLPNTMKATEYGWSEIQIMSVTGEILTFVGVFEMDDDVILFLDMSAFKFYSNGFFKRRVSPDGKSYFEVRNTTGFQYIIDICCFGDLVVHKPANCGILYGISY